MVGWGGPTTPLPPNCGFQTLYEVFRMDADGPLQIGELAVPQDEPRLGGHGVLGLAADLVDVQQIQHLKKMGGCR